MTTPSPFRTAWLSAGLTLGLLLVGCGSGQTGDSGLGNNDAQSGKSTSAPRDDTSQNDSDSSGDSESIDDRDSNEGSDAGAALHPFFSAHQTTVDSDAESYANLEAMAQAADAVVMGHLSAFGLGREVTAAGHSSSVLGIARVAVDELVRGTLQADPLQLELLSSTANIQQFSDDLPDMPILLFLREREAPTAESGVYTLVNSHGAWIEIGGELIRPFAKRPEAPLYTEDVGSASSLSELADQLRTNSP